MVCHVAPAATRQWIHHPSTGQLTNANELTRCLHAAEQDVPGGPRSAGAFRSPKMLACFGSGASLRVVLFEETSCLLYNFCSHIHDFITPWTPGALLVMLPCSAGSPAQNFTLDDATRQIRISSGSARREANRRIAGSTRRAAPEEMPNCRVWVW